ncbi:MAG: LPS export ABC transporter periplasmic protein LptC [Bacteroidales bacterium]|jgi:LPS export ABC transporter protein LptC|nr:LPS export ABC transporter periplasmic protein LptC [Bacteroidales bacterium]
MKVTVSYIRTIGVLIIVILIFGACRNDIAVVNNIFKNDTIPGEIAKNIHLFISQSGVVTHEFKAPILYTFHSPETYQECPKGVEVITYGENKQKLSKLTALYGVNYETDNIMEAKRNVIITNYETGEIIETEHLIWDVKKKIIYSNTQIKQTKSDGSIYIGRKFESDESLSKYVIYNPQLLFYENEE